jgi:hypothetical protein
MPTGLGFDRRSAQFVSGTKSIARDKVRADANTHAVEVGTKLKNLTRRALTTKMDAGKFQTQFAQILKASHIQLGLVGRGGKELMAPSDYGKLGSLLKKEYSSLKNFTQSMIDGELSLKQAIARAGQYGTATLQAYGNMEQRAIADSKLEWARRKLTSGVKHCPECVNLATYPKYRKAADMTPIGVDCSCHGNCRCAIEYAINPPIALRIGGKQLDPIRDF